MSEAAIYALLRKYRVQKHYRASSAEKVTRYAVYVQGEQITDPKPFAEARADADKLTAKAVMEVAGMAHDDERLAAIIEEARPRLYMAPPYPKPRPQRVTVRADLIEHAATLIRDRDPKLAELFRRMSEELAA